MSLSNRTKIPYAFSARLGRLVSVDEVEQGLACNCTCPSCGMKLEAKQGDINIHHFSHHNKAEIDCQYSFWVSIRDLAKQILRELKYLECKNIPKNHEESIKKTNRFYELELFEEKKMQEKYGMDIFFASNIGLIGIYFLTGEKRNKDIMVSDYQYNHYVLEIDLASIQNVQSYTIDTLKEIVENPYLKRFTFSSLYEDSAGLKVQKNYERLYKSKSIMNMEDLKEMKINSISINSFEQCDFSAINVAKLYYQNMFSHFKNNEDQESCKELHVDEVHTFYQYKNQYYATATIRSKCHVYQVFENKIVLIGKCFKKEEIAQMVIAYKVKVSDENIELKVPIKKHATLF